MQTDPGGVQRQCGAADFIAARRHRHGAQIARADRTRRGAQCVQVVEQGTPYRERDQHGRRQRRHQRGRHQDHYRVRVIGRAGRSALAQLLLESRQRIQAHQYRVEGTLGADHGIRTDRLVGARQFDHFQHTGQIDAVGTLGLPHQRTLAVDAGRQAV